MKRKSIPIIAAALLSLGASAALANDTEPMSTPVAGAPQAMTDWSGAFLGAQVGAGFGDSDFRYSSGANADHDLGGTFLGVYGGYDFQFGANVVGLDVSYNFSDVSGSASCPNPIFTCTSGYDNFGTIRGRYGRAFDDLLVYGAAGYAYGRAEGDAIRPNGISAFPKNSTGVDGWTAALGAQKMLASGWALRGEVAYYDLSPGTGAIVADAGNPFRLDMDMTTIAIGIEKRW